MKALFTPLKVGRVELSNRMLMAPLTRCRASDGAEGNPLARHTPTPLMVEYYSQRASAGLIISEATIAVENGSTFATEAAIYSKEQVAGWKQVADAVHSKGGKFFIQLYHGGRTAHSSNNKGQQPVGPSAIRIEGEQIYPVFTMSRTLEDYEMPRELTTEEIAQLVQGFAKAAQNAIDAGCDGVEIHAANGYLIDQFLRSSANNRKDQYGGSLENRARFLLEIIEAASVLIGADRIGVRLSPLNSYQNMSDEDPIAYTKYLCQKLKEAKVAYVHLMRTDFFGKQLGDVVTPAREIINGEGTALLLNMGYKPEEAEKVLETNGADAIVFGTLYISNPDLPARVKAGAPLAEPNSKTFYTQGPEGYTDYPSMSQ